MSILCNGSIYRKDPDLTIHAEASGSVRVARQGTTAGIVLDPHIYNVWCAADGNTVAEVASRAQVSMYLAACSLTVLQRAGLLSGERGVLLGRGDEEATEAGVPRHDSDLDSSRIVAIVIHHDEDADLDACLHSLSRGNGVTKSSLTLVAAAAVRVDTEGVGVVDCTRDDLVEMLQQALNQVHTDLVLVLDSQVTLAAGAVKEMARILDLRHDLAAVSPRVMWKAWPGVIVSHGDWRTDAREVWASPHTGSVDVHQFRTRWHEAPAVHFGAALLRCAAVHDVPLPLTGSTLDWIGVQWSRLIRKRGYHTVAALHALAYGPWPMPASTGLEVLEPTAWPVDWPRPLVENGMPAVTVDSVRGAYCHDPNVSPGGVHPRVVVVAGNRPRVGDVLECLMDTCDVQRVDPIPSAHDLIYQCCQGADLIVASEEAVAWLAFLQHWPGPIVLDAPPVGDRFALPFETLGQVDGVVCIGARELGLWLDRLPDKVPTTAIPLPAGDGVWVVTMTVEAAGLVDADVPGVVSLADFCRQPAMAPRRELEVRVGVAEIQPPPPPPTSLGELPAKAWRMIRERGVRATAGEVRQYVRWKVGL